MVLAQNMPGWTEENHEEALPGYPVSWLRLQPVTTRLQGKRVTGFGLVNMHGGLARHRPAERITPPQSGQ